MGPISPGLEENKLYKLLLELRQLEFLPKSSTLLYPAHGKGRVSFQNGFRLAWIADEGNLSNFEFTKLGDVDPEKARKAQEIITRYNQ